MIMCVGMFELAGLGSDDGDGDDDDYVVDNADHAKCRCDHDDDSWGDCTSRVMTSAIAITFNAGAAIAAGLTCKDSHVASVWQAFVGCDWFVFSNWVCLGGKSARLSTITIQCETDCHGRMHLLASLRAHLHCEIDLFPVASS